MQKLRIFPRIARPMQRLGYLKHLIRRIASSTTSNLENIGNDLVDTALKKVKVQLTEARINYIKIRLSDRAYNPLKEAADQYSKNGGNPPSVSMELQDLYLADPVLPSQVGKLVREDWRKYPGFGINLGMIREGTYSLNTRGFSFLHLTSDLEQKAFFDYLPDVNPFLIDRKQNLLLLFALLENDGEIIFPLWSNLLHSYPFKFSDREVGNFLPEIYQSVINRYRSRAIPIDFRERLSLLEKSAANIVEARKLDKYTGGGAREESSRPRIEPYTDLGLLSKPNLMKYEYFFTPAGIRLAKIMAEQLENLNVEEFLLENFFRVASNTFDLLSRPLTTADEIVPYLRRAAKLISSSSGYAPIEELALLSGIIAIIDDQCTFEIGAAREALIIYQKANPYLVRFTVDRLGVLAHAKFMDISGN